ncbi:MAG: hypothetical protein RLZZ59_868 [Pseudomonadota bacterium]|jgi:hypothetical protein
MKEEKQLWNCCRTGNTERAKEILATNKVLDLTYDSGSFFKFAINGKNAVLLELLLKYYEGNKLSGDRDSLDYKKALFKLKQILEDAEDMFDFSKEVEEVLKPYRCLEEEEERSGDLDDFLDFSGHTDSEPEVHQLISTTGLGGSNESLVGVWDLSRVEDEYTSHYLGQDK